MNRLLAAFEASMRRGAKDENEWRRIEARLKAEPDHIRKQRRAEGRAAPNRMSVDSAEAMLARFAASDAMYGAT